MSLRQKAPPGLEEIVGSLALRRGTIETTACCCCESELEEATMSETLVIMLSLFC